MSKRKLSTAISTVLDFKGFDDYVELFKAGEQTDSLGVTRNFTTDDLDAMVRNHESFPIVIGHPKTDAPAYGWSAELKREGDSLFGKFEDVEPQFSDLVEKRRYPNRSVRIRNTADGYKVAHVGFLGAAAPAVPGLKPVEFAADDAAIEFEFSGYGEGIIARTFRSIREFIIEKYGMDEADKIMPQYDIDALQQDAIADQLEDQEPDADDNIPQSYNKHSNGGANVPGHKTYTQEEVDNLLMQKDTDFASSKNDLETQLTAERKKSLTADYSAFINKQIDSGKLTPAMAAGAVDFMLQLSGDTEFEFSQGEGDKKSEVKTNPVKWFQDFVESLGKGAPMGESTAGKDLGDVSSFAAPPGAVVDGDRAALDRKAQDYMAQHNCDYVEAVVAVGG